jgi:hypothetical protein
MSPSLVTVLTPTRRVLRLTRVALAASLAAGALSACGSSHSANSASDSNQRFLNTQRVALAIDDSILAQRDLRAQAFCPAAVPQVKGQAFTCIAYAPHVDPAAFNVVQVDGSGHVQYSASK